MRKFIKNTIVILGVTLQLQPSIIGATQQKTCGAADGGGSVENGECASTAVTNDGGTTNSSFNNVGSDSDNGNGEDCQAMVQKDLCNSNPAMMFDSCLSECTDYEHLGAVGYFNNEHYDLTEEKEKDVSRTIATTFEDFDGNELPCQDLDEKCAMFIEDSHDECRGNEEYMTVHCAKTCMACFEAGTTTFPIGIQQEIHPDDVENPAAIQNTLSIIRKTYAYMSSIMTDPAYESVRAICQNTDEYCSSLASDNLCEEPEDYLALPDDDESVRLYDFMMDSCAPTCQACDLLLLTDDDMVIAQCTPDESTNVFGAGGLNLLFERIVGEREYDADVVVPSYTANVISRPTHPPGFAGKDDDPTEYFLGPWILTLDNFLTDEECDRLIKLGSLEGYERSTLEEEKNYSEEEKQEELEGEDPYRTSSNSWCDGICYTDPVAQNVMGKIANLTGVPEKYSEYMQLLKYVPGQYYKEHHDYTDRSEEFNSGPRMITVFLYLNDVEEGGATRFTDLTGDDGGIFHDVQPKKGTALLWPSVFDEDPSARDDRTYHEALNVLKGEKYGANAWLHLRRHKDDPCDYDRWFEITGHTGDEEGDDDYDDEYDEEEEYDEYYEDGGMVDNEEDYYYEG